MKGMVRPQDVSLTREELPPSPMKLPSGYCKRLKGAHDYQLHEVKTYPYRKYPHGWGTALCLIVGWADWKEYRCEGCGKKRMVREEYTLPTPIPASQWRGTR